MANDYRERSPYGRNRGMFGYEGEGFMERGFDRDRDDFDRQSGAGDYRSGFAGGYGGHRDEPPGRDEGLEPSGSRGWNIGRASEGGDRYGQSRASFRGRGPKNYRRSDDRILEELCERLTMDHDIDAREIEVRVEDGVVSLEGTVTERLMKRLAEDLAEDVRGVRDVQNRLRVGRAEESRAQTGAAGTGQ